MTRALLRDVRVETANTRASTLRYKDFPISETEFHWQSQAGTRQSDEKGERHIKAAEKGVVPLLFVRDSKKDARGVTEAFRFLGPVSPSRFSGERPISVEWALSTPLRSEWLRKWGNVG